MATDAYNKILRQVQLLSYEEQLKLLEELTTLVRLHDKPVPLHSILEFEGLGKEIWEGVDVQEYINQERASWDEE
jgi:hypothetical protein